MRSFLFPLLFLLLPTLLLADPELTSSPAVQLDYQTEPGKFHQLQRKDGNDWVNVGYAVRGTGRRISTFHPPGEHRVFTPSKTWVLVWSDEFDGVTLDHSKWGVEENNYGGGNQERQFYSTDPKYCYVKDGKLHIAVYRDAHTSNDGKTSPYTSARIRTLRRGDWKYGKFEFRAKVPDGQGIWPAIWMLPTGSPYGGWAASGEIDILESRGSKVEETTSALHFGGAWPRQQHVTQTYAFPGKNGAQDFHVYTLEWSKEEFKWSVDGVVYQARKQSEWFSEAAADNPRAPFDTPFHIVINVAVDGRFFNGTGQSADKISSENFPQILEVDYARVYQWAE